MLPALGGALVREHLTPCQDDRPRGAPHSSPAAAHSPGALEEPSVLREFRWHRLSGGEGVRGLESRSVLDASWQQKWSASTEGLTGAGGERRRASVGHSLRMSGLKARR